ncbi:hypothetical protein R1flu_016814 [Riccia fluitans]|uniref:Uncharacterized protein n=1 Tax=Riccia fluitans TaxID=41844 RepID=A0ABD1YN71_9MARC
MLDSPVKRRNEGTRGGICTSLITFFGFGDVLEYGFDLWKQGKLRLRDFEAKFPDESANTFVDRCSK